MTRRVNSTERNVYVVLNPVAGNSDPEDLREALVALFEERGWIHDVYLTTGRENVSELTRAAVHQGADLVVAAGGDGTVSGVVNGIIGTPALLGIVPVGTGNGLARALNIPLSPEKALRLLAHDNSTARLDTMRVGDQYFVLNVSSGISSRAMVETAPEEKQRFGMLAYAQKILRDLVGVEPVRFILTLDGFRVEVDAIEVLVSNGDILTEPSYLFGSKEDLGDGQLGVNIVTAKRTTDFVRLAWDLLVNTEEPKNDLQDLRVRESIRIEVAGDPQPVQGDGEPIQQTPVEVKLVPRSLEVIIPGT